MAANVYLKHVFHYGTANPGNAFGAAHVSTVTDASTGSLGIHQWVSCCGVICVLMREVLLGACLGAIA